MWRVLLEPVWQYQSANTKVLNSSWISEDQEFISRLVVRSFYIDFQHFTLTKLPTKSVRPHTEKEIPIVTPPNRHSPISKVQRESSHTPPSRIAHNFPLHPPTLPPSPPNSPPLPLPRTHPVSSSTILPRAEE